MDDVVAEVVTAEVRPAHLNDPAVAVEMHLRPLAIEAVKDLLTSSVQQVQQVGVIVGRVDELVGQPRSVVK
ncbi:MAG TPA: hypothetical protein VGP36_13905, partial [Mycobacteriales bacterium]|nr:hypothetical protein [Mycobacteriales bacterium]